MNFFQEEATEV